MVKQFSQTNWLQETLVIDTRTQLLFFLPEFLVISSFAIKLHASKKQRDGCERMHESRLWHDWKGERNWEGRKARVLVLKHEHNTNKHINSKKHMNPQTPKNKHTQRQDRADRNWEVGRWIVDTAHVGKQQGWCLKGNIELRAGKVDNAFIVVYTLKYTLVKTCKHKQD